MADADGILSASPSFTGQPANSVLLWNGAAFAPGLVPGDNWGSQAAQTNAPLTGNGTASNPLGLAPGSASGHVLTWNGTNWVSQAVPSSADNWGTQVAQVNAPLTGNGTAGNPLGLAPGAASGHVLTWNGTNWVSQAAPSGADNWGTQVAQVSGPITGNGTAGNPLTFQPGTAAGQVWQWNGSNWVLAASAAGGITQIVAGDGLTGTNLTGPTATLNVVAENGLTALPDAIRLGGTLLQNTDIALAGFNLTATGVGRVGFGTAAPTERLHVVGNTRLDGALMPNNNAGANGQYLRSNGPGVAPSWGMNAAGINAIERYVIPPINIGPNTTINYTVTGVPGLLPNHSVMVNLYGEWGVVPNVRINHVEARTGEIRFTITNQSTLTTYNGMDFILTVIR
jgi:hypothetical protein